MKPSDEWETPQKLFDELNKEFNFNIDLCATESNTKCDSYCVDFSKDALPSKTVKSKSGEWASLGEGAAFLNPPYSNPKPFIELAYESLSRCKKVVCLLKCDTSTSWWGIFWDYENHKPKPGVEIRFLPKRLKFERDGKSFATANFPSVIVIMDRRNGKQK